MVGVAPTELRVIVAASGTNADADQLDAGYRRPDSFFRSSQFHLQVADSPDMIYARIWIVIVHTASSKSNTQGVGREPQ